jgi:hypothetical protein
MGRSYERDDAEVLKARPICQICHRAPSSIVVRPRGWAFAWCQECAKSRRPGERDILLLLSGRLDAESWH